MTTSTPHIEAWHRACDSRDPHFDGVFLVAITSTRIYCRPICPSRLARRDRRRFFLSRQDAETAGFRPCRRCRPEMARGSAPVDAVARLAAQAAERIAAGVLNVRGVRDLAAELGVGERQLRRALRRELEAAPRELALAQRLSCATRLLTETTTPVIQVAYASGFRSLRRFNAAFRQRFGTSPSMLRRALRLQAT